MSQRSEKTAEIRTFIVAHVEKHSGDVTTITADQFKISKQAVRKHIQALADEGAISVSGATRDRKYELRSLDELNLEFSISPELSEDGIWRQSIRPKLQEIKPNVIGICQYGFTEMVNNVIDHSEGQQLLISLRRTAAFIEIMIADDGIGILVVVMF